MFRSRLLATTGHHGASISSWRSQLQTAGLYSSIYARPPVQVAGWRSARLILSFSAMRQLYGGVRQSHSWRMLSASLSDRTPFAASTHTQRMGLADTSIDSRAQSRSPVRGSGDEVSLGEQNTRRSSLPVMLIGFIKVRSSLRVRPLYFY